MELCSMLYGNLDERVFSRRLDTCICMAESLCSPPEAITTLLIGYTPIQNKKSKLKKKEKENQLETGRKTPKQLRMKERSIWNQIGRKGKWPSGNLWPWKGFQRKTRNKWMKCLPREWVVEATNWILQPSGPNREHQLLADWKATGTIKKAVGSLNSTH